MCAVRVRIRLQAVLTLGVSTTCWGTNVAVAQLEEQLLSNNNDSLDKTSY